MMRLLVNWKFLSLTLIIAITLFPYLGVLRRVYIDENLKVFKAAELLGNAECKSRYNLVCSKAIVFELPKSHALESFIPGVTTTSSKLVCVTGDKMKDIKPDAVYGVVTELNKSAEGCEKIISYFRPEDESFSSWNFPFLIQIDKHRTKAFSNSINFYKTDLRAIIAVVVLFVSTILFLLMNILGSSTISRFKIGYYITIIMTIVNGGIAEKVLFLPSSLNAPILQEFLGLLLVLSFIFDKKISNRKNVGFLLVISVFAELGLKYFNLSQSIVWDVIIFLWAVVTVQARFSFLATTFFSLNCFYLLSVLTPYNFVPPFAGTLFFLVYYIGLQIEQIRIKLVNSRISQFSKKVSNNRKFNALIKLISKAHHIERISIATLKNDRFESSVFDSKKQSPKQLALNNIFNVISKVFASGRPLMHVDAIRDELGSKIANKGNSYNTRHFTSIPLEINGQLLGVVSYSNYGSMLLHKDAYESMVSTFMECTEVLSRSMNQVSDKYANDLEVAVLRMFNDNSEFDLYKNVEVLLTSLHSNYKISGYFSEVSHEDSLILKFASGTLRLLIDDINGKSFRVDVQNEYGPIALAFKEQVPIVLQNWRPISDKISKSAADIYRQTDANSIMTVPVVISIGKKSLRYMLWLQTDSTSRFGNDFNRVGKTLQNKLSEIVSRRISQLASNSLFDLAESSAISEYIDGSSEVKVQTGILLMVDLAKSTALGAIADSLTYKQILEKFKEIVCLTFAHLGFTLQMQIGDALLLTKSTASSNFEDGNILNAFFSIECEIKSFITSTFKEFYKDSEQSVRFCSSFGDISCELVDGIGGGWKIVGNTLNEVHKIEAIAKQYRNGIYFKLNSSDHLPASYEKTNVSPFKGGGEIVYLPFEIDSRSKVA